MLDTAFSFLKEPKTRFIPLLKIINSNESNKLENGKTLRLSNWVFKRLQLRETDLKHKDTERNKTDKQHAHTRQKKVGVAILVKKFF